MDVNARHLKSHPEFTLGQLFGYLLVQERVLGGEWTGPRNLCPDVVAMRFFLAALGKAKAIELLHQVSSQYDPTGEVVNEEQLERLERYFD